MSYVETAWNHANIPVELAGLRPLGDFVLVRVLPEEEMHKSLIWLPQFSGAHADRASRPVMPSVGEVIACGAGDRLIHYWCLYYKCSSRDAMPAFYAYRLATAEKLPKCPNCGKYMEPSKFGIDKRAPMHVSPGDRVLYWRVPANEVILNDETFQFLHEEQHIIGVIET